VDGDGLPIRLALTPGPASDKEAAAVLIASLTKTQDLVADRGYDARTLIDLARTRGARAHIATQKDRHIQRTVDPALYRRRNLVERFFNKLKHFRRVATRFDKLARNFLAALTLAAIRLWTRAYESTT
jgi:transposase